LWQRRSRLRHTPVMPEFNDRVQDRC
jgi:hypothetical protein